MSIKNVIIIGAAGHLGPAILDTFLNESSFNTSILSRQGSESKFPPGVNVIRADYDSPESLKAAFQGQDAVISLLGGMAIHLQPKLIDGAIAAGVKRFIPSDFGSNTPDERVRTVVPAFEAKLAAVNYLKSKEKEISWTSIIVGPFFDWGLKMGTLGLDGSTKSIMMIDGGEALFSTTNLHQIGLAAVKSLEHADETKNQYVYVSGFQTTQKEILAVAEKVTGTKWTVNHVTAQECVERGREKVRKGEPGFRDLVMGVTFPKDTQLGDLSPLGLWNDRLGIPQESMEEAVRAAYT